MKYKLVLIAGLIIIAIIVALLVERTAFFTNTNDKYIKEELFGFVCKMDKNPTTGAKKLSLRFNFLDQPNVSADRDIIIVPIVNQKDTLSLAMAHAGVYNFNFPEKVERLDLTIKYKVDSAGQHSLRTKRYYDLNKTYTYRFMWFSEL
jgi:hypothetical protein